MSRVVLDIAADVEEGLTASPRRLPARLFYDARGSELFEDITRLPEYYLTRTEQQILQAHGEDIITAAGDGLTVVELGAGSATKTVHVLAPLIRRQGRAVFVPVDVSRAALDFASAQVTRAVPGVEVEPLEGRYRVALQVLKGRPGRKLVLFIGSSIGNFDPAESLELLKDIRAGMHPTDTLLLGTDLVKAPAIILPAYDDAQGVTAAFNKNVLTRINRELQGDFDPDAFRHVALWNAEQARIEMHLESVKDQQVQIAALQLRLDFAEGERIHTESSHKFTLPQVRTLLSESGFELRQTWTDPKQWFGLHLAAARG